MELINIILNEPLKIDCKGLLYAVAIICMLLPEQSVSWAEEPIM